MYVNIDGLFSSNNCKFLLFQEKPDPGPRQKRILKNVYFYLYYNPLVRKLLLVNTKNKFGKNG
jgi:hypothetical protein